MLTPPPNPLSSSLSVGSAFVFNICFLAILFLTVLATSSAAALGPAVRTAGNFAILSKAGVSTVPPSVITGNVGVSPISSTGPTGFSLTLASNGESATSGQVTGELFAASFSTPTPSTLTVAIGDMGTAFTDASGRTGANFTNLANAWIFQVTGALTLAAGAKVVLAGGAVSSNIVWVATGTVPLALTSRTAATANSRPLAQPSVAHAA
ncbi:antifreeze protein [Mycena galericulata]|nr:antifreeze protein [Mycena galericulata]